MFAAIVIIVNIKVLICSYQYTFWAILWVVLSIASYFIVFFLLSLIQNYTETGEFYHIYGETQTYLCLIFFSLSYILIDYGLEKANAEIVLYMIKKRE